MARICNFFEFLPQKLSTAYFCDLTSLFVFIFRADIVFDPHQTLPRYVITYNLPQKA